MDVTSAIPTLIGMVADGLDYQKATMSVVTESGSAEVYSFQFNPSTLKLAQTNGQTKGQTLSKDKDSEASLSPPAEGKWRLEFDVTIDRSEVRPQGLIETAAYMLNSLNPLFPPLRVSKTKSLLDEFTETSPMFGSGEKIANNIELWYRWAGAESRDSGSSSTKGTLGDQTVQRLTFDYGDFQFRGHMTSLTVKMAVFDSKGNPRRADLSVQMEGIASKWDEAK